jgi:cyclopropane-fatty-acyl-phospholipid synthase
MNWKLIDTLLSYHLIPNAILRKNIQKLIGQRLEEETQKRGINLSESEQVEQNWVQTLKESPIAIQTDKANEQHYEVPTEFYHYSLGPHLKYSSGLYKNTEDSLAQMEEQMLGLYCERAQLQDGHNILDLGCGWGSLSLFLAKKYPNSSISSLSNSATQRQYIEEQAKKRGLNNIRVYTEDMNQVQFEDSFDRILSIEMFEHLRNYQLVFRKVSEWLKSDGLVFLHIFCHDSFSYPFEVKSEKDWMSKYFFSGGQMPAFKLFHRFDENLTVRENWKVNGKHYAKTSLHWLNNIDNNKTHVIQLLKQHYPGREAHKMFEYWRLFFMSCEELFKWNNGEEWYVGHYLLEKK